MRRRNESLRLEYWNMPEAARAGWRAVASVLLVTKKLRESFAPGFANLKRNEEYRPEVKNAKVGRELRDYQDRVGSGFSGARAAITRSIQAVREELQGRISADPLADVGSKGGDGLVANRLGMLGKMLARQEVDRVLDRAFEAEKLGDDLALLRAFESLSHDPLLAWTADRHGRARIQREGSDAQRQAVTSTLDALRDARIDEDTDLSLLADHRDELEGALQMMEIAEASAKTEQFLLGGGEAGWTEVEKAYAPLLLELEE